MPWNKGIKYRNKTPFIGICTHCQLNVELPPNREKRFKFCSKECQNENLKNHVPWNKGTKGLMGSNVGSFKKGMIPWNKEEPNYCLDCRKKTWRKEATRCKICFAKWKFQIKENHPRWKPDRSSLKDDSKERGGQFHREWSKNIKNRDKWKCRINNKDCIGRLEAHHILSWKDHPELKYDINNGIALCHT